VHNIQRQILNKLLYAESLGYAEMRPKNVESNHFAYHLDQLVHQGLVAKRERKYFLAPLGLAMVDRMSQEKMVPRQQAHILTVIDITNIRGETLLYKRAFQPYIHTYGFPLGKTHLEENIHEAAARELQEKTGLTGIALAHRGIAYVHITQDDFTISKVLCHVFSGHVEDAKLARPNHRGSCHWVTSKEFPNLACMPGFIDIKQLLQRHPDDFFFAELHEQLPSSNV
jgi:ADP-ribose pyrophosphatase YjhB (NUDIX family)